LSAKHTEKDDLIETDVAIIGGGIAGSCAATLLKKKGIKSLLIDPHDLYPKDFRCEKFNCDQMAILEDIGIAEKIYADTTHLKDIWIARFGMLVNKISYTHYGFSYETAINAVRKYLDTNRDMLTAKVKNIQAGKTCQTLVLHDGRTIRSRVVIISTGLNPGLRKQLDVKQTMLSKHHEMALGFNIEAVEENGFGFDSLTFWPERKSEKLAYFTAFKSDDVYRVNLFGYWAKDDPITIGLQKTPHETLTELMPSLEGIMGQFKITSRVHLRPVDLYQNHPSHCDGVVFVGDAYSTSCPGAGTGTTKGMNDVAILCRHYIPVWLKLDEISSWVVDCFYKDESKLASDASSLEAAFFLKSISLEKGIIWGARRWGRFLYHFGKSRLVSIPGTLHASSRKKAA